MIRRRQRPEPRIRVWLAYRETLSHLKRYRWGVVYADGKLSQTVEGSERLVRATVIVHRPRIRKLSPARKREALRDHRRS